MKVYYNKTWGLTFVILSSILIILHLYLASLTGEIKPLNLLAAGLILMVGILYLNNPYFELTDKEIKLFAPLGYAVKTYSFINYADLIIIDNKIYLEKEGTRKKIKITKWMCNAQDWKKFIATISDSNSLMNELHDVK
jgi:hypothetical protein